MLKVIALSSLFLLIVLTGCLSPSGDDDVTKEGALNSPQMGPLIWERVVEDTTYLLRIEAKEPVTVKKFLPEWPDHVFYSIFVFLGKIPSSHADFGRPPLFAYQDAEVEDPTPRPGELSPNPGEERTRPPGSYYVILDSKGAESTFTILSENASLEVVAIDPTMGRYRWSYDDDWEYHTRIYLYGGRQIFDGSTTIPLHHNYTLTFLDAGDDPWTIDLDPLCSIHQEGYVQPRDWQWIVSDEPLDLHAKTIAPLAGAGIWYYTLDLPLPVPETGCWTHDEWKENAYPYGDP